MNRALLALAPALLLLLTACSAPAASPTVDPEPTVLEVAAIDGDWVMTRTVLADDSGQYEPGKVETRYLVFDEAECDETMCSGSLVSAATEDVFTIGADAEGAATATYMWDGSALDYEFDPVPLSCVDHDSGDIIEADVYQAATSYDLNAADETASSFIGSATLNVTFTGDQPGHDCPGVNVVQFDAQLERL